MYEVILVIFSLEVAVLPISAVVLLWNALTVINGVSSGRFFTEKDLCLLGQTV